MKRDSAVWEKISANDTPNKGFISKIYKDLYNSAPGRQTIKLKNGQRT